MDANLPHVPVCRERTWTSLWRAFYVEGCLRVCLFCLSVSTLEGWINVFSLPDGLAIYQKIIIPHIYLCMLCDVWSGGQQWRDLQDTNFIPASVKYICSSTYFLVLLNFWFGYWIKTETLRSDSLPSKQSIQPRLGSASAPPCAHALDTKGLAS